MPKPSLLTTCGAFGLAATLATAQDFVELETIEVEGRGTPLAGEAISASQGYIGRADLETRPILRTGEILEAIPGLIVTQHSGTGKANQYFLRGFNLDHGTDFSTWIDGMPINMVSHGHGQGYTDLNFIIPELTETISYFKGSYYSAVGDFSSAGSASIRTVDSLENDQLSITIGEDKYFRGVLTGSQKIEDSDLVVGLERTTYQGPWDIDEDLDKVNGLLKFTTPTENGHRSITLMGYDASWNSADQIPERAVEQGIISSFGSIDDTVGGNSSRYSLSADWQSDVGDVRTSGTAYAIYYDMTIWSNFTYFLDDPVNGDQFQQSDRRMIYGANLARTHFNQDIFGKSGQYSYGIQTRYDDVDNVGLYHTQARQILDTTREDSLKELSVSAFFDTKVSVTDRLSMNLGARLDYFDFDVDSNLVANSGSEDDVLFSPKLNLIYTASENFEYYLSAGYGFHSNDARGSTITVDPSDGVTPVDSVDPLVRSKGGEIGVRYSLNDKLHSSIALWSLELDSELLYVGDAGNTEATVPSKRHGIEFSNFYAFTQNLTLDFDLAFTEASLRDVPADETDIPGAIDRVASLGLSYRAQEGWFGGLRYRHFGERPLIEDGSVSSPSFHSTNAKIGYKKDNWQISLDVLNLLDSDDHDITYFYGSRLQGEAANGVEDRHYHIIEPRALRLNFAWSY